MNRGDATQAAMNAQWERIKFKPGDSRLRRGGSIGGIKKRPRLTLKDMRDRQKASKILMDRYINAMNVAKCPKGTPESQRCLSKGKMKKYANVLIKSPTSQNLTNWKKLPKIADVTFNRREYYANRPKKARKAKAPKAAKVPKAPKAKKASKKVKPLPRIPTVQATVNEMKSSSSLPSNFTSTPRTRKSTSNVMDVEPGLFQTFAPSNPRPRAAPEKFGTARRRRRPDDSYFSLNEINITKPDYTSYENVEESRPRKKTTNVDLWDSSLTPKQRKAISTLSPEDLVTIAERGTNEFSVAERAYARELLKSY